MGIKGIFNCLLLLFLLKTCATTPPAPLAEHAEAINRTAVRAARLLDVNRGQFINDAVVLIEGEKITAVGSKLSIPAGTRIIDLGDATLLPGLIDAHTHITYHFDESGHFGLGSDPSLSVTMRYAAENARLTLMAGYTTIRNLGAGQLVDLKLRDSINQGRNVGPRMLVSGEPLVPDDLPRGANEQTRVQVVRQFVRARLGEGADVIKIFEGVDEADRPLLSEAEIRAAVEEAALAGKRVAVHAHEASTIKAAVRAGCASIEHGSFLDEEAIRLLLQHHTALVPTLYLPTHYTEHREQFAFDKESWEFLEGLRARNIENARRAKNAGVFIVSGSDAVAGLHGQNARELEWLVKAGLTPAEAIRAATVDAARLLGIEERAGDISRGKFADLIAVAGDPLRDIRSLQRVEFVMKGGQVLRDDFLKRR